MAGLKRTDNKGRILKDGESQRKDGSYRYRYTDADGIRHDVYSKRLVPTDRVPPGCKDDLKVYNHWLPVFTVLLGTGCRIGEVIGLRWEDCDFDDGIISINHNMVYRKYVDEEKARFHIVTPKTEAGIRIVPMLSEVRAALEAEWETQKIIGFNESVVDGYTGFIFQNRYGDPLSPHSVNRAIDRICAAYVEDETVRADREGRDPVLIRHFSAHNLRHTFCTRFCENEKNIKVIQEIMGHADIETTMNIYAEATKEKKQESFSNLEGKIKIS